jgi:hypothetical protein
MKHTEKNDKKEVLLGNKENGNGPLGGNQNSNGNIPPHERWERTDAILGEKKETNEKKLGLVHNEISKIKKDVASGNLIPKSSGGVNHISNNIQKISKVEVNKVIDHSEEPTSNPYGKKTGASYSGMRTPKNGVPNANAKKNIPDKDAGRKSRIRKSTRDNSPALNLNALNESNQNGQNNRRHAKHTHPQNSDANKSLNNINGSLLERRAERKQ